MICLKRVLGCTKHSYYVDSAYLHIVNQFYWAKLLDFSQIECPESFNQYFQDQDVGLAEITLKLANGALSQHAFNLKASEFENYLISKGFSITEIPSDF
jgi:hypothetical protein